MSESEWGHDELQADLAESRRGVGEVVCENLSLGSWGGSGEMDVLSIRLSRTTPRPTCYEVKVSRADFLSDVRSEKHRRYEPFARRCYFATPAGMISPMEVPTGWGLTVRGDKGWASLKASRLGRSGIEDRAWKPLALAVLLNLHPGPWAEPPRRDRLKAIHGLNGVTLRELRGGANKMGRQVGAILNDYREMRHQCAMERGRLVRVLELLNADFDPDAEPWVLWRILEKRLRPTPTTGEEA